MTIETLQSVSIDEFGSFAIRLSSYLLNEAGERVAQIANHRLSVAPGDPLPATITVPHVGEVALDAAVSQYAAIAWTPERVAAHRARQAAAAAVRPRRQR